MPSLVQAKQSPGAPPPDVLRVRLLTPGWVLGGRLDLGCFDTVDEASACCVLAVGVAAAAVTFAAVTGTTVFGAVVVVAAIVVAIDDVTATVAAGAVAVAAAATASAASAVAGGSNGGLAGGAVTSSISDDVKGGWCLGDMVIAESKIVMCKAMAYQVKVGVGLKRV